MSECKLKGFQQVLVRDEEDECWDRHIFDFYDETADYPYYCIGYENFRYCIPYEGNENLAGTTNAYIENYEPKDGDFVKMKMSEEDKDYYLMIYLEAGPRDRDYYYACMYVDCEGKADNKVFINSSCRCNIFIRATDSEKELLISKLHENGKDWNAEKKEVVDWKWEPTDNETYYFPGFNTILCKVEPFDTEWTNDSTDLKRKKRNFVFRTEFECQAMCDKLNEAIKDIK